MAGSHATLRSHIRCSFLRLCRPQVANRNRLWARSSSLNTRSIYPVFKSTYQRITMSSPDVTSSAAASLPALVIESRTPFTFKVDHIKRLDSTTNYLSWRNQVSIDLHVIEIEKYVDASTPKPTDTTHLATWTRNDYPAKAAMLSFLSEDFIDLASDATTAKDAWQAVEDHWDLRNSSTLQHTVQSFVSTQMQDTNVLTDHISSYEQKYTYTTERCRSANDK